MASSSSSGATTSGAPLPPLVDLGDVPAGISQDALDAAVAAVRGYCGWHIAPVVTVPLVLDGPGGDTLMLPTLRLLAAMDVTSDGAPVTDPEWSAAGIVRHRCWSRRLRGVTLTITHGYDACPADLAGVVASMASAGVTGVAGQTVGPFSLLQSSASAGSFAVGVAHRAVLDRYRLPALP